MMWGLAVLEGQRVGSCQGVPKLSESQIAEIAQSGKTIETMLILRDKLSGPSPANELEAISLFRRRRRQPRVMSSLRKACECAGTYERS